MPELLGIVDLDVDMSFRRVDGSKIGCCIVLIRFFVTKRVKALVRRSTIQQILIQQIQLILDTIQLCLHLRLLVLKQLSQQIHMLQHLIHLLDSPLQRIRSPFELYLLSTVPFAAHMRLLFILYRFNIMGSVDSL